MKRNDYKMSNDFLISNNEDMKKYFWTLLDYHIDDENTTYRKSYFSKEEISEVETNLDSYYDDGKEFPAHLVLDNQTSDIYILIAEENGKIILALHVDEDNNIIKKEFLV